MQVSWPSPKQTKKVTRSCTRISARGERFTACMPHLDWRVDFNFEGFHVESVAVALFRYGFHVVFFGLLADESYQLVNPAQKITSKIKPRDDTTSGPTYHGRQEPVAIRRHSTMLDECRFLLVGCFLLHVPCCPSSNCMFWAKRSKLLSVKRVNF